MQNAFPCQQQPGGVDTHIIIPRYDMHSFSHKKPGIAPHPVRKVEEALRTLFR